MEIEDEQTKTLTFLGSALEDRATNGPSSKVYRMVVRQLTKRTDFGLTRRLYHSILPHVTAVVGAHGNYDDLVVAIFDFDFAFKGALTPEGEALTDAFVAAALALVSANATLAAACLRTLTRSLQSIAFASTAAEHRGSARYPIINDLVM